ncbi:MAG: hypothetical protein P0S93_06640 [Candidatus Neptunochlamydia sp.]|nr:hypothetical protein [Candidatus Neptunochlamydia sp.]
MIESKKRLADVIFGKGAPTRKEILSEFNEEFPEYGHGGDSEYHRSNHDLGMSGHSAGSSSYAENKASL